MLDALWDSRAATLQRHNVPLPTSSGAEERFWSRFTIAASADLYYADSHAQAAQTMVRAGVDEVWSYDAHHDAGYEGAMDDVFRLGWVGCANWLCYYVLRGVDAHVRYPSWRSDALEREVPPLCPLDRAIDDEQPVDLVFERVFVCRSSAWTPPWLDDGFYAFLERAPVRHTVCLDAFWRERSVDLDWIDHLMKTEAGR
jgi:hypothetical protein